MQESVPLIYYIAKATGERDEEKGLDVRQGQQAKKKQTGRCKWCAVHPATGAGAADTQGNDVYINAIITLFDRGSVHAYSAESTDHRQNSDRSGISRRPAGIALRRPLSRGRNTVSVGGGVVFRRELRR